MIKIIRIEIKVKVKSIKKELKVFVREPLALSL